MLKPSLDAAYFDNVYAASADPWHFSTSEYEREKYASTLDALGTEQFERALEIGCSIGVFTAQLAERCRELVGVDINERALVAARRRCASQANVRFEHMNLPQCMPSGGFDLVVLSEVGYYWSDADLELAKTRIAACAPGGTLELVHYRPKVRDYVRDGDAVHEAFRNDPRFAVTRWYRTERYRIDLMRIA